MEEQQNHTYRAHRENVNLRKYNGGFNLSVLHIVCNVCTPPTPARLIYLLFFVLAEIAVMIFQLG